MKQVMGVRKIKPCRLTNIAFGTCFMLDKGSAEDNDRMLANAEKHDIYMRICMDKLVLTDEKSVPTRINVSAEKLGEASLRCNTAVRLETGELFLFADLKKIVPVECNATFIDYYDWETEENRI